MNSLTTKSFELATYSHGNEASEKLALVLPGRCDTKDYAHIQEHVHYLGDLGWFALSFDPPGTWETSEDIQQYTLTNYQMAINEVIESRGNPPTLLFGHSRGGSMAMLVGATNPHVVAYGAAMSHAVGSLPRDPVANTELIYRDMPPGAHTTSGQKEFKLPSSFFMDAVQHDATPGLVICKKPKLFILAIDDDEVTPQSVIEAHNKAAEPKVLGIVETEHNYRRDPKAIARINRMLGRFLLDYQL